MRQERRYTRYKQVDVFLQLAHYQKRLKVKIVRDSVLASGASLLRLDQDKKEYRAAVLARSSDWYRYSLNSPEWQHGRMYSGSGRYSRQLFACEGTTFSSNPTKIAPSISGLGAEVQEEKSLKKQKSIR